VKWVLVVVRFSRVSLCLLYEGALCVCVCVCVFCSVSLCLFVYAFRLSKFQAYYISREA